MKKILVVFCGGTIGSSDITGTINTKPDRAYNLLQLFAQHYPQPHDNIRFESIQPLHILSENIMPKAWEILINAIETSNIENYDGIIITHGTDTLSYTAAALSFYFHSIKIPILLVSSNYPLDYPESNGLEHFIYAVDYILQQRKAGVFIPYRSHAHVTQLHHGTRLASSLQLSSDFVSVTSNLCSSTSNYNSAPLTPNPPLLKAQFSNQILLVKPYPSLNYQHIRLSGVQAVLHELYHSGTACVEPFLGDNKNSLLEFIKRCNNKKIKVYLAPALKIPNIYQSTQLLINQGAIMLWNMSLEATYIKLLLAYGNFNNQNDIINFLNANIAGEQIDCNSSSLNLYHID